MITLWEDSQFIDDLANFERDYRIIEKTDGILQKEGVQAARKYMDEQAKEYGLTITLKREKERLDKLYSLHLYIKSKPYHEIEDHQYAFSQLAKTNEMNNKKYSQWFKAEEAGIAKRAIGDNHIRRLEILASIDASYAQNTGLAPQLEMELALINPSDIYFSSAITNSGSLMNDLHLFKLWQINPSSNLSYYQKHKPSSLSGQILNLKYVLSKNQNTKAINALVQLHKESPTVSMHYFAADMKRILHLDNDTINFHSIINRIHKLN